MNKIFPCRFPLLRYHIITLSLCLGLTLTGSVEAYAGSANQEPITVVNSDGSLLTIILCGDECCHFYTTLDGIPVVQEENGNFRVAPQLTDSINNLWKTKRIRRNARRMARIEAHKAKARTSTDPTNAYQGKKRGIVILANFSNLYMKSINTPDVFYRIFNEPGYHDNNHYGSVHDYFKDQSYGKFDLTFDLYGPVEASNTYAHYGGNKADGDDKYVAALAAEICTKADQMYDINWADYDWDGNGEVDQVFIVYAGYGEQNGAPANTIWPHEWTLTEGKDYGDGNGPITLGGCVIDTYAMACELSGTRGSNISGIGTACHEFCHCLGLPDFYDISYKGGFGMDTWDLMDKGDRNGKTNNGEQPAGFTAYERWCAGWLDFIELDQPATITQMPALQDSAVAYIIYNENYRNEFFTLENRQNHGWFTYTKNYTSPHGLLICHVDYNAKIWEENEVNTDTKHQRMTIIPAGREFGSYNTSQKKYTVSERVYQSQLFPGTSNVSTLDYISHENVGGRFYHPNEEDTYLLNKPITDIQETNGLISFKFRGGTDSSITPVIGDNNRQKTEYFTLNGIKVNTPTQPGFYILRQGNISKKIHIRQ